MKIEQLVVFKSDMKLEYELIGLYPIRVSDGIQFYFLMLYKKCS